MAATDPRTTILDVVDAYLVANPLTKDAGANATHLCMWEGGPETLKYLFYDTPDVDVLITFDNPKSRGERYVQDVPVHYQMLYPFTVTTIDKYNLVTGVRLCTAVRMQYKATYAIRLAIEGSAQSGGGAPVAYTMSIRSDSATRKRVGGLDIWETPHVVEYETDYA